MSNNKTSSTQPPASAGQAAINAILADAAQSSSNNNSHIQTNNDSNINVSRGAIESDTEPDVEVDEDSRSHTMAGITGRGRGQQASILTSPPNSHTYQPSYGNNNSNMDMSNIMNILLQNQQTQYVLSQQLLAMQQSKASSPRHTHTQGGGGAGLTEAERGMIESGLRLNRLVKFGGESNERISSLLTHIHTLALTFGWTERVSVRLAGLSMTGKASEWYYACIASNAGASESWNEFNKECLARWTRRISTHLVPLYMGAFDARVKQGAGERSENYLARLRDELQQINSAEPHWLVFCFLCGLRKDILEQVKLSIGDREPPIDELLKEAVRIETAYGDRRIGTPNTHTSNTSTSSSSINTQNKNKNGGGVIKGECRTCGEKFEGTFKEHASKKGCAPSRAGSMPNKPQTPQSSPYPPKPYNNNTNRPGGSFQDKPKVCHNCGQAGHIKPQCPKLGKASTARAATTTTQATSSAGNEANTNTPPSSLSPSDGWRFDPMSGESLCSYWEWEEWSV